MNAPYTPFLAPSAPDTGFQAAIDWSTAMTKTWVDSQRLAWEAAFAMQKAMFNVQQELWDEWTARFGGGVPIDG